MLNAVKHLAWCLGEIPGEILRDVQDDRDPFRLFKTKLKRKQLACKPGSVLLHLCFRPHVVQRLSFICAYCYQQTIAVYPPARASNPQTPVYMTLQLPGRTAHGLTTRLVGSYPTFSPLPHRSGAVIFFCVSPAVADTLHINKRDALCCPDFPHTPRGEQATDRPTAFCVQN